MDKWGYNYLIQKKALWEKEKLLVTSNFSFSHNVFKSCLLLMHQNEYLWSKGLRAIQPPRCINPFPSKQILDFTQTKRVCGRQFYFHVNGGKFSIWGRKRWGKRRNCPLQAISPFPSVFERHVLQTHNNKSLFGKGLNHHLLCTTPTSNSKFSDKTFDWPRQIHSLSQPINWLAMKFKIRPVNEYSPSSQNIAKRQTRTCTIH